VDRWAIKWELAASANAYNSTVVVIN